MKSVQERIGFVGVGRMGANMARRLQTRGYHDRRGLRCATVGRRRWPSSTERPAAADPRPTSRRAPTSSSRSSPTTRRCDAFFAPSDDSLLRTRTGEAVRQLRDRSRRRCTSRSSSACESARRATHRSLHGELDHAGARGNALPDVRRRREAFERRAADPRGAQRDRCATSARPVERAKVKALVNMVMNINTAGLAEGLGLGDALGLDLTMLREVFAETGAASRVLETDGEDMQNREHDVLLLRRARRQGFAASRLDARARRVWTCPSPRRRRGNSTRMVDARPRRARQIRRRRADLRFTTRPQIIEGLARGARFRGTAPRPSPFRSNMLEDLDELRAEAGGDA